MQRGEIWYADLNPTRGSEQSGIRPVLIVQNDAVNAFTVTVLVTPLTTNLRRVALPTCSLIPQGEGGLLADSVALCHQTRVLDTTRLLNRLGQVSDTVMQTLEKRLRFTFGLD